MAERDDRGASLTTPRFFCDDYEELTELRDGTKVLLRLVRPSDKQLLLRGFEQLSARSRYLRFLTPKAVLTEEELRYLTELDGEDHFAIGAVRLIEAPEEEEPEATAEAPSNETSDASDTSDASETSDTSEASDTSEGSETSDAGETSESSETSDTSEAPPAPRAVVPGEGLGIARMIRYPGEPHVAEAAIAVADSVHGQGLGTLLFMRLVAAGGERGITRFRCEVHATNSAMRDLISSVNPEYTLETSAGVMSIEFELPPTMPAESPAEPPRETSLYRFFQAAARRPTEWVIAALQLLRRPPG